MTVVGIHGYLPAYIEVDLDEGTITHQGVGGDFQIDRIEIPYGRDKNGKPKAVPPTVRALAEEVATSETLRGKQLDWPGWDWG